MRNFDLLKSTLTKSEKSLTILLYHGVTNYLGEGIENLSRKHISSKDFYDQMVFIKKNCNILSMDEVANIHKNNLPYPKNKDSN